MLGRAGPQALLTGLPQPRHVWCPVTSPGPQNCPGDGLGALASQRIRTRKEPPQPPSGGHSRAPWVGVPGEAPSSGHS